MEIIIQLNIKAENNKGGIMPTISEALVVGGFSFISACFGVIASALGFERRLNKIEENVVYKDVCNQCQRNNDIQFESMHSTLVSIDAKIDTIKQNQIEFYKKS